MFNTSGQVRHVEEIRFQKGLSDRVTSLAVGWHHRRFPVTPFNLWKPMFDAGFAYLAPGVFNIGNFLTQVIKVNERENHEHPGGG
jgi:hypothetical protein